MLSALMRELDGIDPGGVVPIKVQKKVSKNQGKTKAKVKTKLPTKKQSSKSVSAQKRTQSNSLRFKHAELKQKSLKATQERISNQKVEGKGLERSNSTQKSVDRRAGGSGLKSKLDPSLGLDRDTVIVNLRESLVGQKTLILNKSRKIEEEALINPSDGVQDEADQASRQLSLNLSLNLHERDRNALFLIEKALSRIQNGNYGLCDRCGIEIGLRRLQARPFASLCIDCMQDQEDLRPNSSPS